jgi:tetratricopeptide (TPR) repeat protein
METRTHTAAGGALARATDRHAAPSDEYARGRALDALYATGHWLLTSDRPADGAAVFRGMLVLAPNDERAWLGLGACHETLSQTRLALDIYGTALAMSRTAVRARLARARLLARLDRDDEAAEALLDAEEAAATLGDECLIALVAGERRGAP